MLKQRHRKNGIMVTSEVKEFQHKHSSVSNHNSKSTHKDSVWICLFTEFIDLDVRAIMPREEKTGERRQLERMRWRLPDRSHRLRCWSRVWDWDVGLTFISVVILRGSRWQMSKAQQTGEKFKPSTSLFINHVCTMHQKCANIPTFYYRMNKCT